MGHRVAAAVAAALLVGLATTAATAAASAKGAAPAKRAAPESTLERVRKAGALDCGINRAEADYSKDDTHGNLAAFGADVCKAVGIAVLGPDAHVIFKSLPDEPHALRALATGAVALVAGATPSVTNRVVYSAAFGPTLFFDGQGFIVAKSAGVSSLTDFAGKQICYISNTHADATLIRVFRARNIAFIPFPFEEQGEMEAALFTGHCAAVTGDLSQIADTRYGFHGSAERFDILDDIIELDPLAPAYRAGDAGWSAVVDATMNLLIDAEARGITAANVDAMAQGSDPEIRRLLGTTPGIGRMLGLEDAWAVRVLRSVGNYGEIYERDLGEHSPLQLRRGRNELWTRGGLLYSTPFR